MTGAGGVAIIGMAGRFPGAATLAEFWENVKAGRDGITHFSLAQLDPHLTPPEPGTDYVCARGMLDGVELFDASFFGYLPREAAVMDPQHRIFLEICHEALERGGVDPARTHGSIGCFAGCYMDTYILHNLCSDDQFRRKLIDQIQVGTLQTELGNDKDYLATRVAFKLGLKGPALTLQTACSTSLVAIATACQSIEAYACDMALAGGVTVVLPQYRGYNYREGGMLSPVGTCRPFDQHAAGTVFSNGAAVLLLKRLNDAIADNDTILAVIRGYATNNDGAQKLSYTAPSVAGQAEVISLALGLADIHPRTIGYVEAHGTATPLGDPIELAGLTTAFRQHTNDKQYCALGSVKSVIGHLDVASGAIGTIKAALMLAEGVIPPLAHFDVPNPRLDLEQSPFFAPKTLMDWPSTDYPRRAGVSSFGVGGTNAHLVLEQAPARAPCADHGALPILLSARDAATVAARASALSLQMKADPSIQLGDVCQTLIVGRTPMGCRIALTAATREEAIAALDEAALTTPMLALSRPRLVFMFTGQGSQYPGMARALYGANAAFRDAIDEVLGAMLGPDHLATELRQLLLWEDGHGLSAEDARARLAQTKLAQPALFAVEYALSRSLAAHGVHPDAVIGHSVGEFAAAVVAGALDVGDAARLVAARGRAMQAMPPGAMLAVFEDWVELAKTCPAGIHLAADNAPSLSVVSGSATAISDLEAACAERGIRTVRIQTSHAFHSADMDGAAAEIRQGNHAVARVRRCSFYSTLTGAPLDQDHKFNGDYWADQLRAPVRFRTAVEAANADDVVFVELGPGETLRGLAARILPAREEFILSAATNEGLTPDTLCDLTGKLWARGTDVDFSAIVPAHAGRVPLPTYPFSRDRHWIEPRAPQDLATSPATSVVGNDAMQLINAQMDIIRMQLEVLEKSGSKAEPAHLEKSVQ